MDKLYKTLTDRGWEQAPDDWQFFTVWTLPKRPGEILVIYSTGTWQHLDALRSIRDNGNDFLSLELFLEYISR